MPTTIRARCERPDARVLGVIVNPLAGVGGAVGLKGSDGAETVLEAHRRGARPQAAIRAQLALRAIAAALPNLRVATAAGDMGADVVRGAGLDPAVVYHPAGSATTGADTQAAVMALIRDRVDLILFAGGDGTARDVLAANGASVPILGVPAGVKMHSAVFGTTPQAAGQLAALYLRRDHAAVLRDAEVMDFDEAAMRADRVSARLHGYARSPYAQRFSQNAKAGARAGEEATLDAIAGRLAREMRPDRLYILGPGTTTRRVATALDVPSTLLGVDAVLNRQLVGRDLDEAGLLRLMRGRESDLVVGVLGGQGSLFGRGNQQMSAEVIRRAGRDHIVVIAALEKLIALQGQPLRVDTGDPAIDAMLTGHIRVSTGLDQTTIYPVQA